MKKRIAFVSIILGTTLLVGCSGTSSSVDKSQKDSQESTQEHSSHQQDAKKDDSSASSKTEEKEKSAKKAKEPERPFEPIQAPKDAKSLKTKYSSKVKKHMPNAEAHGEKTKRSVPLGQRLLKGKEDQTNGPLKKYRLVAYYGTPGSDEMGILGESSPEKMMKKLKKQTKAYSKLDPERPAVPTIELISTVAQRKPGPDDLYVHNINKDDIKRYAKVAKKHHALLLLDVQLGQASVMHQVKQIAPYLKLPHVHLAIDTEYSVKKGKIPGVDLGHVNGKEVQKAVKYVDKVVRKNHLPDKVVVVHQFGNGIVTHKKKINPTKHVEVALNYDGFGDPNIKKSAYGKLVRKQSIQYGGFKLFYKNDKPLLTPKKVLKLDPAPAIVDYQ